ncbi:MAG: hypothetical protein ACKVK0_08700 [Pirellulales bacterium]|jgi:hypothetical protein|tara:strand:+ start:336 stop:800 length:465 start_codon:yes stop_codon:yes gene_type:complete
MASDSQDNPLQAAFSSIDVTATSGSPDVGDTAADVNTLVAGLMRRMITEQEASNTLLKELIGQIQSQQRGRAGELDKWKEANPKLANRCRVAAETLSDIQNDFLMGLTAEVEDSEDALRDSDYMLQEFVDRYGPRLAHLNGVLQVLSQLAAKDS